MQARLHTTRTFVRPKVCFPQPYANSLGTTLSVQHHNLSSTRIRFQRNVTINLTPDVKSELEKQFSQFRFRDPDAGNYAKRLTLHSFFANRFADLIIQKKYKEIVFVYQKFIQAEDDYAFLGTGAMTSVIRALGKLHMTDDMELLFNRMNRYTAGDNKPNIVTCNAMLVGFAESKKVDKLMNFFQEIPKLGYKLSTESYNTVLSVHIDRNETDKAVSLLQEMQSSGIEPSDVTYSIIIAYFIKLGEMQKALELLNIMKQRGFSVKRHLGRLLAALAPRGDMQYNSELQALLKSDLSLKEGTSILKSFVTAGDVASALHWFRQMKRTFGTLDIVPFNLLLKVLKAKPSGDTGATIAALKDIWVHLQKHKARPDSGTFAGIFDVLASIPVIDNKALVELVPFGFGDPSIGQLNQNYEGLIQLFEKAMKYFKVSHDHRTLELNMECYLRVFNFEKATQLLDSLLKRKKQISFRLHHAWMSAYATQKNEQQVLDYFFRLDKRGVIHTETLEILTSMYAGTGNLDLMWKFTMKFILRQVGLSEKIFNHFMTVFVATQNYELMLSFLDEMQRFQIQPTMATYEIIIPALTAELCNPTTNENRISLLHRTIQSHFEAMLALDSHPSPIICEEFMKALKLHEAYDAIETSSQMLLSKVGTKELYSPTYIIVIQALQKAGESKAEFLQSFLQQVKFKLV